MHSSHLDRIRLRISIWIPKHYHKEPVLSRLTSDHHLTVNITEARLGADS
jgi:NIL domain